MSEYNEGDLVEATKGEGKIIDRVAMIRGYKGLAGIGVSLEHLENVGYTLTLIEKSAPPLPAEPGHYVDVKGDAWTLAANGFWYDKGYINGGANREQAYILSRAPFARLEPVADTARKVVARLDSEGWNGAARSVRAQFGLTE